MNIVNLHLAPTTSFDAVLTHAYLRAHTDRLDELNATVEDDIRRHAMSRARLEATIERLIAALDADDGDENLERDLAGWDEHDDREGDLGLDEDSEDDARNDLKTSAPETYGRGFGDCAAAAARRESLFSEASGVLVTFKAGRLTQARAIAGEVR